MAEDLPILASKVVIDHTTAAKGLDAATEAIHKFTRGADRAFNEFQRNVRNAFGEISGAAATQRLAVLEKAVERMGGASKLTAPAIAKLGQELERLAASGSKVPAALQPVLDTYQKMQAAAAATAAAQQKAAAESAAAMQRAAAGAKAIQAQAGQLQQAGLSVLQGGGVSGALSAIGPAGVAAAAGITALTGAFLGMGRAALGAVQGLIETTGRLTDLAAESSIGVESLQRLSFAAEQSGVSAEELSKAAFNLQKSLAEAPEKFEALGLSARALREMSPEEQFVEIAKALKSVGDESEQAAVGAEIFGNGFRSILPLLRSDIAGLTAEAERLGIVFSKETVEAGDKLGDELNSLSRAWGGLEGQLAGIVARNPDVVDGIADVATAIGSMAKTIRDNQQTFDGLAKFLSGLSGLAGVRAVAGAAANFSGKVGAALGGAKRSRIDLAESKVEIRQPARTTSDEAEKALRDVEATREKIAADRKRAAEKMAADAKRAAEDLDRLVGPSMAKIEEHAKKLAAAIEQTGGAFNRSRPSYEAITRQLQEMEKAGVRVPEVLREAAVAASLALAKQKDLGALGAFVPGITTPKPKVNVVEGITGNTVDLLAQARAEIKGADDATIDWSETLADVSHLFDILGISAESAMGKVLGSLTAGLSSFDKIEGALGKGIKGFLTGGGLTGIVGAIGVVKQIGSLFTKPEHEKVMEDVGRDFGVKISEGLAKQIAEDSKALGDRSAASLKNLGGLIDEAGGVKGFGLDKAIAGTRDLFSALQRGQLSARDVGETFEQVFGKILPEAIDKTTGRASGEFKELIALSKQFGIESAGVTGFLDEQAAAVGENLAAAIKAGVQTEGGAAGLGASIAAQVDELVARGATRSAAIQAVLPAIQALREELDRTGFAGGAAFDLIAAQAGILTNEVTGPLVAKVDALASSLVALDNQGLLTADIFAGLTAEAGATAAQLKEQGVEGPAALAAMQPALQKIFELQQQYGFAVDDTTQKLLDEAQAAGLVGDAHKSAQDRMVDATERVATAVEGLAKFFGVDLPAAAESGARRVQDALAGIQPPDLAVPVSFGAQNLPDLNARMTGFRRGGAYDFGAGSLEVLHGREAVVPADEPSAPIVQDLARSIAGQMGGAAGGGSSTNVSFNVTAAVDPNVVPRNFDALVAAVAAGVAQEIDRGASPILRSLKERGGNVR